MPSGTPGLNAFTGGLLMVMTPMPAWLENVTKSLMVSLILSWLPSRERNVKVASGVSRGDWPNVTQRARPIRTAVFFFELADSCVIVSQHPLLDVGLGE